MTLKLAGILLSLQIAFHVPTTYGLECYDCTNIQNVSDCHNVVLCNSDELCYTDATGVGLQTRFSMGCRSINVCRVASSTTMSPISIIGRDVTQSLDCSQCCGTDGCNKHVCTTGTPATNSATCADDPTFNCPSVSSVFNICGDTYHAQLKCAKFCGFCDHPIVHGQWSSWQSWSSCSVSCVNGTKTRTRMCNNPVPQNGGLDCQGNGDETETCNHGKCPVHGQWSRWSEWGICSVTCGVGLERRDRSCSNPYPGPQGDPCWGDARDDRACFTKSCADGGWSPWSTWGSCTRTCLGGQKKRTRTCDHPTPSTFGRDCVGNNEETEICNSVECPVTNGAWSSWRGWTSCSRSCYGGIKRRSRTCTNPAPSLRGQMCPGNSEQVDTCNNIECTDVRIRSDAGGRLEVFINGTWGTVCDDYFNESNNGAKVVCRMLGHSTSNARVILAAGVTDGSGRIWLTNVRCAGTEASIFDCPHIQHIGNCGREDVGVAC